VCSEGETARAVEGVEEALRPPPTLVLRVSSEGRREEAGVGEWAREEAIEGRGDESVDIVKVELRGEYETERRGREKRTSRREREVEERK
jgi:hypothetical protein